MENGMDERLLPESQDYTVEFPLYRRILEENKLIWKTAFPSILYRLSLSAVFVVTQAFIGNLNQIQLAAYALVLTILVRFVNGILIGMSSATETLCGQAFGAKQYNMLGIYLQRSWIVNTITATIMLPLFFFATPIFKLLKQDDEIADATGNIALWFIGACYAYVLSQTTQMFLQAQRKNMIIAVLSPFTLLLEVLLSWIFVSKLSWGVTGAMCALVASQWVLVFLMLIYVMGGWCPDTWTGFSSEAFRELVPIVKLSVSSGVMLCVQVWYSSILLLLAGYTRNATVSISAFSISLNINAVQYMFCLAFLGTTGARVANELGKGNGKAAKFAITQTLMSSMTFGFLSFLVCIIFGRQIPYLFTSDDEIAKSVANLSVLLAITILLNSIQTVLSGVSVGTGSQAKAAVVNVCSYYVVGVPIGCILDYVVGYGIKGIWIGLISGLVMQALALAYMTWKIDWSAEVDKSKKRLTQFYKDPSEEGNQSSNGA